MKKILFLVFFLISASLFPQSNKPFFIGAMGNGHDAAYSNNSYLGFNIWHYYTDHMKGWSGNTNDNAYVPYTTYESAITTRLSSNATNQMSTLADRPKFQLIAFAQRSDYQCESESSMDNDTRKKYGFYTYRYSRGANINDNSSHGNGELVKYLSVSTDTVGYILKDLRSNREQINRGWEWIYPMSDGNMQ
jgi:hypothetical protein